ncbi:hypothetical protein H206_03483 [Candidatus Electrothrix aarhusensis]|uniref:Uncharacterized protein n=1 Tax=Candidatus Electrothrix aarhusensis TaxID=1859131 RepID=A0A444IRR0_9BACT|nr:hypothetical protein H206_03483 [Candidatus Electrothrix aarhusensis]
MFFLWAIIRSVVMEHVNHQYKINVYVEGKTDCNLISIEIIIRPERNLILYLLKNPG